MKKMFVTLVMFFFIVSNAYATEKVKLVLPNFLDASCVAVLPQITPLMKLDERFYNSVGAFSPVSCKGRVCWSWTWNRSNGQYFIYSSDIPIRFSNLEKATEDLSLTLQKNSVLKKGVKVSISTIKDDIMKSSTDISQDTAISKSESYSQSKTKEKGISKDMTTLFHFFLTKALAGPYPSTPPLCMASAVDLIYRALLNDKINDLIQAFIIYKHFKPSDITFTPNENIFVYAKFIYNAYNEEYSHDDRWSQAVLFASLLSWPEFNLVKESVDKAIQECFQKYNLFLKKNYKELEKIDKTYAVAKYVIDRDSKTETEAQDNYLRFLMDKIDISQGDYQKYEEFIKKYNPIVEKVKHLNFSYIIFFVILVFVVIAFFIFLKKYRKTRKTTTTT